MVGFSRTNHRTWELWLQLKTENKITLYSTAIQIKVFSPYDMRNEDDLGHEAGKDSIYAVKKVARSNKEA